MRRSLQLSRMRTLKLPIRTGRLNLREFVAGGFRRRFTPIRPIRA